MGPQGATHSTQRIPLPMLWCQIPQTSCGVTVCAEWWEMPRKLKGHLHNTGHIVLHCNVMLDRCMHHDLLGMGFYVFALLTPCDLSFFSFIKAETPWMCLLWGIWFEFKLKLENWKKTLSTCIWQTHFSPLVLAPNFGLIVIFKRMKWDEADRAER